METNRRFSILTFPQFFDGATLKLNVVVLPRNQNPLVPAIGGDEPSFAEAALSLEAKIISGLANFPNSLAANDAKPLLINQPAQRQELFLRLGNNFKINNLNQSNANLDLNADKANVAVAQELSVKKYLPESYRQSFNFTTPRNANAVIDDSYACAVRGAEKVAGFKRDADDISWGKVFAYALRQPQLAKALGMIYETEVAIDAAHFPKGGWLYVDLAVDSDYREQQQTHDDFIKRYAARIPPLTLGESRPVFAPLLFPVLPKANAADPDPAPDGNYDELFIEAASFDDGFAKIVHARQPHSRNLLAEKSDGAHPVKDAGIRLGWDDEQILVWFMRQMMIDTTVSLNPDKRIDAPLGVFGYAVDVRESAAPENQWESLNEVASQAELVIPKDANQPDDVLSIGNFAGELPYQVYPAQLDGNKNKSFWLPMYFANWNGHNIVLPDREAAEIYQTTNPDVRPDHEDAANDTGTGVTGAAQNNLNKIYEAANLNTALRYGHRYEFRIRLRDLSGGGTPLAPEIKPRNEAPSQTGACHFKRYVAPNRLRVADLPINTDAVSEINTLSIRRPLLGYPAAVYTDSLYADAVNSLKAASEAMKGTEAFGIADPDVNRVEITVEVQTLKMDNLLSVTGKEPYVHLYTTRRAFPVVNDENDYETALEIPVVYRDCKVLHTGDETDLINDLGLPDEIDNLPEIVLPTARTVRFTLRAACEDKANNKDYYGLLDESNHDMDARFGQITQVVTYKPSEDETDLFVDAANAQKLKAIFLQPDAAPVFDGESIKLFIGEAFINKQVEKAPDMIERLANQLDIVHIGLTLTAAKGERVQFGCSNRIRHTLSPDNSSITFASKGDLMNHWLCCINLQLDRDWTWDALEHRSLVVNRTVRFTKDDAVTETDESEVGDVSINHTASFEALQNAKRNYTRMIFIDAVEPKNHRTQLAPDDNQPRFPDTIEVGYKLESRFKPDHAANRDDAEQLAVTLPITTPPAQIPKIVSAGIALSPYRRNDSYSATEPRQRFLWIEFAEAVKDPDDTYFARVLAYAPDQLISNNHPSLFIAPKEPTLAIDPEQIRVVTRESSNDLAGLNVMKPMQKASDSNRHYLLPLPNGIHADASEMFGFFTYELRVGHFRNPETKEMVWTTAQGRFGRPLRASGIQHPAPTLVCAVNRDEQKLYVNAPYAVAVFDGRNVTADPPRTQLWCLLYAQVTQADNLDFRNVLLDDKQLDWQIQIEDEPDVKRFLRYDGQQRRTLKNIAVKNWKDELDYGNFRHVFKLAEPDNANKDATKYGTTAWSNSEVSQLLSLYGLPPDSRLSVLVVEFLPTITNIHEHISKLHNANVSGQIRAGGQVAAQAVIEREAVRTGEGAVDEQPSPLSERLGERRILRTSPLTEVPFVCCADC